MRLLERFEWVMLPRWQRWWRWLLESRPDL